MKKTLPIALALIVLVAIFRLLPHPLNFTPVGAIALFSGAYLTKKWFGWLIPIGIMLVSDIALHLFTGNGFHDDMFAVYAAFLLIVGLGKVRLGSKVSPGRIAGSSIIGSMAFFLITNFSVWATETYGMYTNDLSGLIACYVAAIPFYTQGDLLSSFALNGIIGDLMFNGLLFGAYALISNRVGSTTKHSVA